MPRAAVSRGGFLAGRSRRRVQADCRYLKAQSGSESPNNATAPCLVSVPLGVIGNTPDSGSGESWFDPRRGNSKRDAEFIRVALLVFLGPASVLQAFTPLPLPVHSHEVPFDDQERLERYADIQRGVEPLDLRFLELVLVQPLCFGKQYFTGTPGKHVPATSATTVTPLDLLEYAERLRWYSRRLAEPGEHLDDTLAGAL